jgi:hypothetical protein
MAIDSTVKIFDQFYNLELFIDGNQYEIVYSFFRNYTSSEEIASTYAEALFKISSLTGIPVSNLLETFQGSNGLAITATIAYYLNSLGNKTLMYGVSNSPIPVEPIQRNIIQ